MSDLLSSADGLLRGRSLGLRYRLALPRSALCGRDGVRLGIGTGASLDFHDYRDYHPGDDLRHLDWSVYARSDREVVKLFREEVAPHLDIVLDVSRSMALEGTSKAHAAAALAAACATAAEQGHCTRTLWLAGDRLEALSASRDDPAGWPPPGFDAASSPEATLRQAPPVWRRHGIRVFISDLLWPGDPTALVARLARGASALVVIQLLATEEEAPVPRGPCRLMDVESGEEADLLVDVTACARYGAALERHREAWAAACRSRGASFVTVTAETFATNERLLALEACGLLEAL